MKLLLYVLLGAALVSAGFFTLRRFRRGGGCCGDHEPVVRAVKPAQRGKPDGPQCMTQLRIGGMTCNNCARKVQNALNSIPGVNAKVSISGGTARVWHSAQVNEAALKQAVKNAGYVVTGIETGK